MAQIFDNAGTQTKNTIGFAKWLETRILQDTGVPAARPTTSAKISPDMPLFVMCENVSRIAADIKSATRDLNGIPDNMVAIIIIHAKAKHLVPILKTSDVIQDTSCTKYGLLVDFGYMDGILYDCEQNKRGEQDLKVFLKKHIKHPIHSYAASLEMGNDFLEAETHGVEKEFVEKAQIFDNAGTQTKNTIGFAKWLETRILQETGVQAARPTTSAEISPDMPLLVMCQKFSRIAADIESVTRDLNGIPDNMVAIIIIHAKAKHLVPTLKTSDVMQDTSCTKYGLLVDFGYMDGILYDCEQNKRGKQALKVFLDKHTKPRIHSSTASCEMGSDFLEDETHSVEKGLVKKGKRILYPIQFYAQPGIDNKPFLKIPEEIQIVKSVADLQQHKMWIIVDRDGSADQEYVPTDEANITFVVSIVKDQQCIAEQSFENHHMHIKVKDEVQDFYKPVMAFLNTCLVEDVSALFNKNGYGRIEVFGDDDVKDLAGTVLGQDQFRVLNSVAGFTKQDHRVLWVIVCKNKSPLETSFDQVYPANAKVILVVDEQKNSYKKDESRAANHFLLTITASRQCLRTKADNIKGDIFSFMVPVLKKLLMEPVKKLFEKNTKHSQSHAKTCPIC